MQHGSPTDDARWTADSPPSFDGVKKPNIADWSFKVKAFVGNWNLRALCGMDGPLQKTRVIVNEDVQFTMNSGSTLVSNRDSLWARQSVREGPRIDGHWRSLVRQEQTSTWRQNTGTKDSEDKKGDGRNRTRVESDPAKREE